MVSLFAEINSLRFWPKTMDYMCNIGGPWQQSEHLSAAVSTSTGRPAPDDFDSSHTTAQHYPQPLLEETNRSPPQPFTSPPLHIMGDRTSQKPTPTFHLRPLHNWRGEVNTVHVQYMYASVCVCVCVCACVCVCVCVEISPIVWEHTKHTCTGNTHTLSLIYTTHRSRTLQKS